MHRESLPSAQSNRLSFVHIRKRRQPSPAAVEKLSLVHELIKPTFGVAAA